MQIKYYSVYDGVADEFGPLFPHRNDNSAFRAYELGLKDKNPDEYELWFIGSFTDSKDGGPVFVSEPHRVYVERQEDK